MNKKIDPTPRPNFEIEIAGHLSDQRGRRFEDLQVTRLSGGNTRLSGKLLDQAQLFGVLAHIRDMGLQLMSIHFTQHKENRNEGDSR